MAKIYRPNDSQCIGLVAARRAFGDFEGFVIHYVFTATILNPTRRRDRAALNV